MSEAESDKAEEPPKKGWPGAHVLRLDLRSLAVLRIVYGVILFLDNLVRWTDIVPHYSEHGVLPRRYLLEYGWNQSWFSLHMASQSMVWINFLFLLMAASTLAMLVGWRTRWATLVTWILLISIQARNPMVLNGGDIYLRCILFWMLLLPTGQRWSVDAKQGRGDHYRWMGPITGSNVFGMSALVILMQISFVYWFAAVPKSDPSWVATYTATQQTLTLDQFVTPLGKYFRVAMAEHLGLFTFLVIWWETWGPFFLWFPFDRGQVRTLGIFGFMALHAGFGSMMHLGFFAWTGALTPLVLLPSWFWDSPLKRFSRLAGERLGECDPVKPDPRFTWPREALLLFLILYCLAWNMSNENLPPHWIRVPERLKWIGHATRLDQRWNMFSPKPLTEDGWYVIEGRFKHGPVLDLFNGGKEMDWNKPADVATTYPNQRWRKYMMNLWLKEHSDYRLPYGQYLCRKWNPHGRGADELTGFDIVFMLEVTNPDGTEQEPEKKVIWTHWCFDDPGDSKEREEGATEQPEQVKND